MTTEFIFGQSGRLIGIHFMDESNVFAVYLNDINKYTSKSDVHIFLGYIDHNNKFVGDDISVPDDSKGKLIEYFNDVINDIQGGGNFNQEIKFLSTEVLNFTKKFNNIEIFVGYYDMQDNLFGETMQIRINKINVPRDPKDVLIEFLESVNNMIETDGFLD